VHGHGDMVAASDRHAVDVGGAVQRSGYGSIRVCL
jgi:hypothetical protein